MEGTSFEEDWAVVVARAPALRRVVSRLHQVGSGELGPVFAELDAAEEAGRRGSGGGAGPGADPRGRAGLGCGVVDRVGPVMGAVLPRRWRGFVGEGGRGGRQAVQRPAGRGGPLRAGPGRQRRGRAGRDGQAVAAADPGVCGDGAGRVRGDRRDRRAGPDPGAATAAIARYGRWGSSSAGRTCSSTAGRCPSRTPMTGWRSTGYGWTPKARRCSRRSWGRWPHRNRPR